MENYFYKCEACGFINLVPAYWVNFSPEKIMEFPHLDMQTREMCPNVSLALQEEVQQKYFQHTINQDYIMIKGAMYEVE